MWSGSNGESWFLSLMGAVAEGAETLDHLKIVSRQVVM